MAELNRLLADNLWIAIGLLTLIVLVLLVAVAVLSARLRRAVAGYRTLVRDSDGGSLKEVLDGHIERVSAVHQRLDEVQGLHAMLERRSRGSLQHIGMVRYNPFEDTGSDQSFAIALLDDRRDGIVMSSLHGRANTRIFAKPVEAGVSPNNLSAEEAQAIRIAMDGTDEQAGVR